MILKKHETVTDNPLIRIYVNKKENRITFKIGYQLELLTLKEMKLLTSTKSKITKDENDEIVPHLEINEVILAHYNIVNNDYQHDSRVFRFVPNKLFGQVRDISPKKIIFFKKFNSGFSYIEVWFSDQNSKPLEIEDHKYTSLININLVIK